MAEAGAITDVRALLRGFSASGLRSCHIVTDGLELFLSRDATIGSPMGGAEPAADVGTAELRAPHLGTLAALAAPGTTIPAGGIYGNLGVLDEVRELVADSGGTIVSHCRRIGELIEFGELVALISA